MFFKDFVSVKRKKIKKGASQTYDTPSSYHVQLLRQRVAVFLHNRHLLLRACCLYCLLPFYQSILSSQRRSVTSTSSGAESSAKAFSFILQMIIIFSENLSFFCCFFSFFRSRVCRIRFHDSVVIFLFRMFAASFFQIPPRSGHPCYWLYNSRY